MKDSPMKNTTHRTASPGSSVAATTTPDSPARTAGAPEPRAGHTTAKAPLGKTSPHPDSAVQEPILSVQDLHTEFAADYGLVRAVNGVSFDLYPGETLGIVGESGSGKSVTSVSVLGLIPSPPGRISGGRILYKGKDLVGMGDEELGRIRGKDISMIFQDPMTSLNPLMRIGEQVSEALELHRNLDRKAARAKAVEMLAAVGIPDPARRATEYPHQFSGGMRQRVMIAMALSCEPDILIADEPTTALDVTIQAQILDLVRNLGRERKTAVIMITHDLGVVAGTCDRVCVMYAGRIVEQGPVDDLFREPLHPYTQGLLASIPRIDTDRSSRLYSIPGSPPSLVGMPEACAYAPRCPKAMDICRSRSPGITTVAAAPRPPVAGRTTHREVRCWLHAKG